MNRILFVGTALLVLAGCQTTSSSPAQQTLNGAAADLGSQSTMTGEQISAGLSGYQARVDTVRDEHTVVSWHANGTVSGYVGGKSADEGTWRVTDRQYCDKWSIWREKREDCYDLVQITPDIYAGYLGGKLDWVLTVEH